MHWVQCILHSINELVWKLVCRCRCAPCEVQHLTPGPVGVCAQVQCILHFLQLPIEDQFIDELEQGAAPQSASGKAAGTAAAVDGETDTEIPFMDTSNPIMAQVRSGFGYCVSWQYNARGGGVEGDWEFSCFFVKNYTPNQGRVDQSSGYGGMAVWQGHRVAMSNGPAVP